MKTKLLFFLLTIFSFTSCVEYVDNGIVDFTPEPPEQNVFTAEHANPDEAKYMGDTFVFKAFLNDIDVTPSTKFRINGTQIVGNTYIPHRVGSNSVIATMDDYEFTFRFTVEEKGAEPEPAGNRIDYNGASYGLDNTYFILNGTPGVNNDITLPSLTMLDGTTPALNWRLVNWEGNNVATATTFYLVEILTPFDGTNITHPFEATRIDVVGVDVKINGTAPFSITNTEITFASTGNSGSVQLAEGVANYTSKATGANSGDLAELFWSGDHLYVFQNWSKGAKGSDLKQNDISKAKTFNKDQIKNLKIAR